ncbi:MAG: glycine zipper family protein [Gammaproteobacteria bacterium]|nr:MAG: glycine zipper family protein [Gammaproteobacteria bacterium]
MFEKLKTLGFLAVLIAIMPTANAQSAADCAAHADRVQRDSGSTMGGAAGGAVAGTLFGAIVGDSSKAAGRGALLGGTIGGVRQSRERDAAYKRAYDRCMAGG